MSQLIYSMALRQVQTLSNSISLMQLNLSRNTRYFSSVTNNDIFANRIGPLVVLQRTLYSPSTLGLEKVISIRENKLQLYQNHKDRYIERLAGYLDNGNVQSILKDDLTNLIGLTENEQHLELLEKIVINMRAQHEYNESGWGAAVMRLYYTMDQVDRAYNNLKDHENFGEFFNQYTTYRIALTMLYNASRYEDVMEIYQIAMTRLKNTRPDETYNHNPGLAVVAIASLAKLNTPEALLQAEKIYNEIDFKENNYMRTRFVTFLSYMALEQDKPTMAMNLISDSKSRNYVALRELKTLSLLRIKRYEDIVYHLRDSITRNNNDTSSNSDQKFDLILREVLESLEAAAGEIQDEITRQTLTDTLAEIKQSNMIGDSTVESIVFAPVKVRANYLENYTGKQQSMNQRQRFTSRPNQYNNRDEMDTRDGNRFVPRNRQRSQGPRDDFVRRNNYNERPQRHQSKSYFEDDPEPDFDDAISTQKRFR